MIHDINDFPLCSNPNCKNKIDKPSGFLGEKKGFRSYCCIQCGAAAPDVIKHRQENCMVNYGVTNKKVTGNIEFYDGKIEGPENKTIYGVINEVAKDKKIIMLK